MIDLKTILTSLAARRPIFHSEADFQHALAWEIQTQLPEAQIRLEVPISILGRRGALDLLIVHEGLKIGCELKYLKARLDHIHSGETFRLRDTSASDQARYDTCRDVSRLEQLLASGWIDAGFTIVLTNEPKFWRADRQPSSIDVAFKLSHGRDLAGTLAWAPHAGTGTIAKRENALVLSGTYALGWTDYSRLDARKGEFRVLVIPINDPFRKRIEPEKAPAISKPVPPFSRADRRNKLRAFFRSLEGDELTLGFDEIEAILGTLPNSASLHQAWWCHVASHAHAVWELEGFRARPDLSARFVHFRRQAQT